MQPIRFQQTIEHVAHVSGRGYWSGRPNTLTFLPAPSGSGIVFRRVDLHGQPEIHTSPERRREMNLRTTLVENQTHVEMVEHVLAALQGMEIDNCIVECEAPEMPGMDGSALAFVLALERAGAVRQNAIANNVTITVPLRVGNDRQWIMAVPSTDNGLTLQYQLDYGPNSTIPSTTSTFELNRSNFIDQIAPARTFVSEAEARELQMQGIASHVTYRDLLVFGPTGPIDNSLRYADECSRHKLLDLIGDLALSGLQIQGKVIACRSGHILNGRMAEAIRNLYESQVPLRSRFAA